MPRVQSLDVGLDSAPDCYGALPLPIPSAGRGAGYNSRLTDAVGHVEWGLYIPPGVGTLCASHTFVPFGARLLCSHHASLADLMVNRGGWTGIFIPTGLV